MNRAARIGIFSLSVVIFCYAGIGHVLGRTSDDKAYKSLTVYGEVLQKIQQDYVDDPNMRTVTAGALHGLPESLDPQSSYLTPREYEEYKKKTGNPGTGESGLTLSKRYGYIIVLSVLPDSPGTKAGIRSGDLLESIGGFTTRDMSVGQALNLLNGQPGTGMKISVIRRGKATPDDVDIVREKLATPKLIVQKADPDILVMRFPSLDAGRAEEVRNRLMDAEKQGVHKVIWKSPVSVLVDTTTSGAAEVLASAMEANHRGDVVGERTFGLASEQKLITLDDGAALILTVANYYNADGKSILEEGVTPTEIVRADAQEDSDSGDDETAPAPAGQREPGLGPRPLSPEDPVYHRALELLKAPAPGKKAA